MMETLSATQFTSNLVCYPEKGYFYLHYSPFKGPCLQDQVQHLVEWRPTCSKRKFLLS